MQMYSKHMAELPDHINVRNKALQREYEEWDLKKSLPSGTY